MRLIDIDTLDITDFNSSNENESYLILSHTWNSDPAEELSYDDFTSGDFRYIRKLKESWDPKVKGFIQLGRSRDVRRGGIDFLWIDTCCIDKSRRNEESQSIRSMWDWYGGAQACIVYLEDVDMSEHEDQELFNAPWKSRRKKPRWFTRGWTLQELLAPKKVYFFDRHWKKVGDRRGLAMAIGAMTNIPTDVLRGDKTVHSVPTKERILWVQGRHTKKEEDMAYCLFGILGVSMEVLYGEKKEGARQRLFAAVQNRRKYQKEMSRTRRAGSRHRIAEADWSITSTARFADCVGNSFDDFSTDARDPLARKLNDSDSDSDGDNDSDMDIIYTLIMVLGC